MPPTSSASASGHGATTDLGFVPAEVALRAFAAADIDSAVIYYRTEAGPAVALDFVEALEAAIGHFSRHPLAGSLRFAYELDIPGLRCWSLRRFPYLVFYLTAHDDRVDIWRVLHARRDIPASLATDPRP